jgi:hypothetical protein
VGCFFEWGIVVERFRFRLPIFRFRVKLKHSGFDDRGKMKEVMKVAEITALDIEILLYERVAGALMDAVLFCLDKGSMCNIEGHSEQE